MPVSRPHADLSKPKFRAAVFPRLLELLLDPRRTLSGFSFGRSHRDPKRVALSVLVPRKKSAAELTAFDVEFPSGGFEDAGEALGIPELAGISLETRVEAVGELVPQTFAGPQYYGTYGELRSSTRPACAGSSVGHVRARGTGTIGPIVRDRRDGRTYLISNNHVLALGTGTREYAQVPLHPAVAGDEILQPGKEPLRPVTPGDVLGVLRDFLPLRYLGTSIGDPDRDVNKADAALAEVALASANLTGDIPYLGSLGGPGRPIGLVTSLRVGQIVKKVGRTTGLTFGRIIHGSAVLRLDYPEGAVVLIDQVITTHMSAPGDSGSLVLTENHEAAGLLLGGSDFISIFTPLPRVLRLFREHAGYELELLV